MTHIWIEKAKVEQALEALEINAIFLRNVKPFKGQEDLASDCVAMTEETITSLRQAIATEESSATQENVLACIVVDVDYSCDTAVVLIQDTRDYEFNNSQYWLTDVKPQPKEKQEPKRELVGLTEQQWFDWWRVAKVMDNTQAEIDFADFILVARAIEAAYCITGETK